LDAVGVNYIDLNQRSGAYPATVPFVPGSEGAGVVAEIGPGVTDVDAGDRGAFATVPRAYAEYAVVPADRLILIPAGVTTEQAAAVTLQGMTAHYLVNSVCPFEAGEWCLVHAAAGGVGSLLTQFCKRRGLRVIGTASTPAKAERAARAGADHVVVYTQDDFVEAVADLTEGRGVKAAFDAVGKTTFDGSLRCIGRRGYMVLFGQASGPVDPFDPRRLQKEGSLLMTRPALADYISTRDELLWRGEEVLGLVGSGELAVHVHASFSMEDAADAHRALEGRGTMGKLILVP
jgi:NADPH:quinone reductase